MGSVYGTVVGVREGWKEGARFVRGGIPSVVRLRLGNDEASRRPRDISEVSGLRGRIKERRAVCGPGRSLNSGDSSRVGSTIRRSIPSQHERRCERVIDV